MKYYVDSRWCSLPCVKSLLIIFNIAFWLSGLAIIWAGIWMELELKHYLKASPEFTASAPFYLVAVGSLILFASMLACTYIVRTQPPLLYLYGGFLVILFFIELSLVIFIYAYKNNVSKTLYDTLTNDIFYASAPVKEAITNVVQNKLNCCTSYENWFDTGPIRKVSRLCCLFKGQCNDVAIVVPDEDCTVKLLSVFQDNMEFVTTITAILPAFPLIGTLISCYLASNMKMLTYERIQ